MVTRQLAALGGLIVLMLGTAACGEESVQLSGSIRVGGSPTMAPLTKAMAQRFMAEHPDVRVTVRSTNANAGLKQLCRGEVDVSSAADRLEAAAIAACEKAGAGWGEIPVVNDAVIVLVNTKNPVDCLTTKQLNQIWRYESEVTERWTEVDDLRPPYDDLIIPWGPGVDTEVFAFFNEAVNRDRVRYRDYNDVLHKLPIMIGGIASDSGATGYVEYGLYSRHDDEVKALAVDAGDGCVRPTPKTIADGTFRPLSRRLFLHVSTEALARPTTQAFLRFYLDSGETVASEAGFVPLTDAQRDAAKARLERLLDAQPLSAGLPPAPRQRG